LLVANHAYHLQNNQTSKKIASCLASLEVKTRDIIKPFMSNPCLVKALLRLQEVPIWSQFFMDMSKFKALIDKKWPHEVNSYQFLYMTFSLNSGCIASIGSFREHLQAECNSHQWKCFSSDADRTLSGLG
jgi:hypothetical protein